MNVMTSLTNEELILRFKETDDTKAFSILVERHQRHILNKCYSYVLDSDTAHDLCQDVLVKLFLRIKDFRNQAKFSTWLFSVIHNTCIDYLRKNKKNTKSIITNKLCKELPDLVENEDEIPRAVSIKILDELLEQMTPDDKMLLLMKYKEKYHIRDIQQTLGISESAIKMRLKRARERINKLYQKYGN